MGVNDKIFASNKSNIRNGSNLSELRKQGNSVSNTQLMSKLGQLSPTPSSLFKPIQKSKENTSFINNKPLNNNDNK